MICLDNSVLSRFASSSATPEVDAYLREHADEEWTVPALVAFEYYKTKQTPQDVRQAQRSLDTQLDGVLPVTDDVAAEAVNIENSLAGTSTSLDPLDLLHAATARSAGATFVTADKRDFDKGPILDLLDVDIVYV
jgi:predicted nucleic acid-binding protein